MLQPSSRHLSGKILEKLDFGEKVVRGWKQTPLQHRCYRTAVPLSPLIFLREDYKALETSSFLGVRCETIGLTLCHASAHREIIIFSSGSKPAGVCRLKNCYLEKKIRKHTRVSNEDNGILLSRFHPPWNLGEIFHKHIIHCLKLRPKCTLLPAGSVYRTLVFLSLLPKDKGQVKAMQKSVQLIC